MLAVSLLEFRRIPGTTGVIETTVHARRLPMKDAKEDYSKYYTNTNKKPFSLKKRKAIDGISNQLGCC
ncbi:hypothetical protein V1514DRAFT_320962 [Lipomyces japonicus]|uniref:uncharacterized protein n=1 Tax=Lipomyces japonicus TaxID=56871 RepID=UPI0034CEA49A